MSLNTNVFLDVYKNITTNTSTSTLNMYLILCFIYSILDIPNMLLPTPTRNVTFHCACFPVAELVAITTFHSTLFLTELINKLNTFLFLFLPLCIFFM